ncbi:hypothetical protein HYFRA_00009193 [Hymenoscyphus fraxineus]|uniref:Uncharacterized protein n=1 Tax=Hymenoscyphus fraxineus TaxID=746836 RepID=A0A9N9KUE1_9HELO|nr:hypothetical protein HYFRA_00009193 [Hymenoscyphus fraxineus]
MWLPSQHSSAVARSRLFLFHRYLYQKAPPSSIHPIRPTHTTNLLRHPPTIIRGLAYLPAFSPDLPPSKGLTPRLGSSNPIFFSARSPAVSRKSITDLPPSKDLTPRLGSSNPRFDFAASRVAQVHQEMPPEVEGVQSMSGEIIPLAAGQVVTREIMMNALGWNPTTDDKKLKDLLEEENN